MPLIFSPLTEELIALPPQSLFPRHAFVMRQIGGAPEIDKKMASLVTGFLKSKGFGIKDADASTGSKDFLERILGLIRGTGLTVAIFSHETRETALANIMLELGFAAMCGKPLMIIKSKEATAPSDLTRTDWIEYAAGEEPAFKRKVLQAIRMVDDLVPYEDMLLDLALDAKAMDCAVAFERAQKAFLLSGEKALLEKVEKIRDRLLSARDIEQVDDLHRLHAEVAMFARQGRGCSNESTTSSP